MKGVATLSDEEKLGRKDYVPSGTYKSVKLGSQDEEGTRSGPTWHFRGLEAHARSVRVRCCRFEATI
jgi:hypothetical protein